MNAGNQWVGKAEKLVWDAFDALSFYPFSTGIPCTVLFEVKNPSILQTRWKSDGCMSLNPSAILHLVLLAKVRTSVHWSESNAPLQ